MGFIILDESVIAWRCLEGWGWCIRYQGSPQIADKILSCLKAFNENNDFSTLSTLLAELPNEWAILASSSSCHIAATDKIRSYPLFYSYYDGEFFVSNSARLIRGRTKTEVFNGDALLEFSMAGYVTGNDTVFTHVKQLQAGELVLFRSNQTPYLVRYFRYLPQPLEDASINWVEELSSATDLVFERLVESLDGRPVLVPLSGGLDSRLIVCMLRHFGYKNVRTFSYGVPGNYEAKIAKKVAATVGYPWEFVPTKHSDFKKFFWTHGRKSYWEYADGLCSVPTMQDIHALVVLRRRGIPDNTIVVNGQSGDFISGGHIPINMARSADSLDVVRAIYEQHFALRRSRLTADNYERIAHRIMEALSAMQLAVGGSIHPQSLFESWEWQERQSKYVMSWQRGYDWLGLGWRLPFWDSDYMKFWSQVPIELKSGQRLYKKYLKYRNHYGLFKSFEPKVRRWPGATISIVPLARLVGLISGARNKDRVYRYARYFGHYGPYYAPWGALNFFRCSHDIRSPVTLFVEQWLIENDVNVELK